MNRSALALALLFAALPAWAETEVKIDPAACRWAAAYQPDTGVTYTPAPGVDLNPSPLNGTLTKEITIDLTMDLASRLNIPASLLGSEVQLGTLKLRDGKLTFNDVPLDNPDAASLQAACQQHKKAQ